MIEHQTQLRVRYAETDQMQFAHHSSYIIWFEYARIELMRWLGINYAQMERDGYLLPVLEVKAQFHRAAHFDEPLALKTFIRRKPRAKLLFDYEIIDETGRLLCSGYSLHTFMNAKGRAVKPPKFFMEALRRYF